MRQKNPLLIVLGACGGCLLVGIIAFAVVIGIGWNKSKGAFNGIVGMAASMPVFLKDLKVKNYNGAAALIEPASQERLSSAKIQKLEETVEKKYGPLKSYSQQPNYRTSSQPGTESGQISVEYDYDYVMTYEKGTATATFRFVIPDLRHPSGKITDFTLTATP